MAVAMFNADDGNRRCFGSASMGVTLPEVLVVLAIVGVSVSLLLPAVSSSRARAREIRCRSRLRQTGASIILHEGAHGALPTCGWGYQWVGFSDRGFDQRQPGGWIYNILPFCEEEALWDLGLSSTEAPLSETFNRLVSAEVALFLCPERGGNPVIPVSQWFVPRQALAVAYGARTDYAMNAGNQTCYPRAGPESLQVGDSRHYRWSDTSRCNGVCHTRSRVTVNRIRDGTTKVILAGEKWAATGESRSLDEGMNQPFVSGDCWDIRRSTSSVVLADGMGVDYSQFGSSHPDAAGFVFCDGSVQPIAYSIDAAVFERLGGRNDGGPTP